MWLICLDCHLRLSNFVFTGIFVLEAIVKIIALRTHYFKKAWNVFDFIIVVSSLVGMEFKLIYTTLLNTIWQKTDKHCPLLSKGRKSRTGTRKIKGIHNFKW